MKYIKLFEAFDANILNRILKKNVLDDQSRTVLLNLIKRYLNKQDIPESKVTDDLFKYLPFKSTLKYNVAMVNNACTNTGEDGTLCTDGKVTKAWGGTRNGYRKVKCPVCDGTGQVQKEGELSLLKFWFDKDGDYIVTTATDGIYREPSDSVKSYISSRLDDYEIVKEVPNNKISSIKSGEFFVCDLVEPATPRNRRWGYTDRVVTDTICVMWKENGRNYAMNNYDSNSTGSDLSYSSEGRKYGRYAWHINASKCKNIRLLKKKDLDIDENNPYYYNTFIDTTDFKIRPLNIENKIKRAHFAIIFDVSLLKEKDYVKKSDIKNSRTDARSNALALVSDDIIRNENIKRYFDKIYDITKVKGEFGDIKKFGSMITRGLGGKYIIFNINAYSSSTFMNNVEYLTSYLFTAIKMLKNAEIDGTLDSLKDDQDFNATIDNINYRYEIIFSLSSDRREKFANAFINISKFLKDNNEKEELEILKLVEDVSNDINKYLNSIKIETIEDIEIFSQEVNILKSIISGDRLGINKLNYFFDNITSYNTAIRSLRGVNSEEVIEGLKMLKTIIKRKQKSIK